MRLPFWQHTPANTCAAADQRYDRGMNFLLAMVAHLVIGLMLSWGILLAVKGEPWLLMVGFLAYALAFATLGCRPKQSH